MILRRWRRSTPAAKARATGRCDACSRSSIVLATGRASPSSRAAIVRRCSRARPRSPLEARPALDSWKPEAPHHSLALGIRLARELAGPDRQADGDERRQRRARAGGRRSALGVARRTACQCRHHRRRANADSRRGPGRGVADARELFRLAWPPARDGVGRRQERSDQGARCAAGQSPRSRCRCPPVCRRCASRCPTMRWRATTT